MADTKKNSEKIKIDYEKMEVTASLLGSETKVILIDGGKVRYVEMFEYGHFIAKTHEGKVANWENAERGKM